MALARSLVDCLSSCHPERRRLHCLLVDHNPRSKLLPAVAHNFELQRNGCQLRRRCMANVYCEFFHISFIVSAGPSGLALIAVGTGTGGYFHKFIAPGKYQTRARSHYIPEPWTCQLVNFFSCTLMGGPTRLKAWELEDLLIDWFFFGQVRDPLIKLIKLDPGSAIRPHSFW